MIPSKFLKPLGKRRNGDHCLIFFSLLRLLITVASLPINFVLLKNGESRDIAVFTCDIELTTICGLCFLIEPTIEGKAVKILGLFKKTTSTLLIS